jgi:flagellar secretion chaperone FliS
MFTSVSSRSAAAYKRVSVLTDIDAASPHQLVKMLFDGLQQAIGKARVAMEKGDIAVKGEQLSLAVRIIIEGLKPALNLAQGGEIAANLNGLYGYCAGRLMHANIHNDAQALNDVQRVIDPIAQGWKEIGRS